MSGRILVTGGNGRLGRTVLSALGSLGVAGVRRPVETGSFIVIDSDGVVEQAKLEGISAIINCAGRVDGTSAKIRRANLDYPLALAKRAKAAGVARFVQVSSFSLYGTAECINTNTAIAPESEYGRSKLAADLALAGLQNADFSVVSLRLPFMFSAMEPALLGKLIATMLRLRVLPSPWGSPSRRSMITYAGAADALISVAQARREGGVLIAADPQPLALDTIAQAVRMRLRKRIVVLPLPKLVMQAVRPLAPGVVDRLLRSSVLMSSANYLANGTTHPVLRELEAYIDRLET